MRNYVSYYKRMRNNLDEKTDHIRKILENGNVKTVFDFGCADGAMIEALATDYPDITFVGYDFPKVIYRNKAKNTFNNIFYVYEVKPRWFNLNTLVILSSVLHEVFTSELSAVKFFTIFDEHLQYAGVICIRDMYFTGAEFTRETQEAIVSTLYKDNYEVEMKENYNGALGSMTTQWLQTFGFELHYQNDYKNKYLCKKVPVLEKFYTTHRKQVWVRKVGK